MTIVEELMVLEQAISTTYTEEPGAEELIHCLKQ